MVLVAVLAGAALVVFGPEMPPEARPALLLGALLIVIGLCGLAVLWFTRNSVVRFLPGRMQEGYARLQGAIFGSLRRPGLVLGIGVLLWLNDGMRVWFVARSLDASGFTRPSVACDSRSRPATATSDRSFSSQSRRQVLVGHPTSFGQFRAKVMLSGGLKGPRRTGVFPYGRG